MWDGLFLLLLLCSLMAAISFLVGSLPLALSLSPRQLRLITALGTGVLVGTSLIVIIPEGVETLYKASLSSGAGQDVKSIGLVSRGDRFEQASCLRVARDNEQFAKAVVLPDSSPWDSLLTARISTSHDGVISHAMGSRDDTELDNNEEENNGIDDFHEGHDHQRDPRTWVGISIITGFILMYLIDTLPRQINDPARPQRFHVSLNSLNRFSLHRRSVSSQPPELPNDGELTPLETSRPSSTTIGLVIHATADGIALGASSTTTSRLSFIIFIALLIHKAPAAFGLTSVLLKQGLGKRAARAHLIVFSLAAPAGALLTWTAAHLLGYSAVENGNNEFATGILLLFSAGTFLYVAMHTMQDSGSDHSKHANGYTAVPMSVYGEQSPAIPAKGGLGLPDILLTVVGMLIPLLTQLGHGH